MSLNIIIVEKTGTLKSLVIKDFKEEMLFKKCGFQKADGFSKQTTWSVKHNGEKIFIVVYGKIEGRANCENKYDFPPPIDNTLFFGACAILALKSDKSFIDLSLEMWEKIYEKLFGGFEDLNKSAIEDEEEIDELAFVPKNKKTKNGYLKDGFVVDSDGDEEEQYEDSDEEEVEEEDKNPTSEEEEEEIINLEDIGSELSEEKYNYSDDSN